MHTRDQTAGRDHQSDPARTPGDGWVDEGGASHLGPATHLDVERDHDDMARTPSPESVISEDED